MDEMLVAGRACFSLGLRRAAMVTDSVLEVGGSVKSHLQNLMIFKHIVKTACLSDEGEEMGCMRGSSSVLDLSFCLPWFLAVHLMQKQLLERGFSA